MPQGISYNPNLPEGASLSTSPVNVNSIDNGQYTQAPLGWELDTPNLGPIENAPPSSWEQMKADAEKYRAGQSKAAMFQGIAQGATAKNGQPSWGEMGSATGNPYIAAAGTAIDLYQGWQEKKKAEREAERQRAEQRRLQAIADAEMARQRKMSDVQMGTMLDDREYAAKLANEQRALAIRQSFAKLANYNATRMGLNPVAYTPGQMAGPWRDPNRTQNIMSEVGLSVPRGIGA